MTMLQVRRLTPFGFELDLAGCPAPGSMATEELRELLSEDGLLVIRGLRLSHREQIEFCRLFGPICESPYENFIVSNVEANAYLGKRELLWHNDIPYVPAPYLAACLHAVDVDPEAVGTRFVSGFRAYRDLPPELRGRIEGLKALQVRERVWDRPNRLTDLREGDICTVHDVVRADPATGKRYLFVNEDMTAQIIGLADAESQELLDQLYGHFYRPAEIYEHKWVTGDMVIWNNLAVQHSRGAAGRGRRTLQRVTIAELGYADMYPTDAGKGNLSNRKMLS